jgi:hypothetical protein
MRTFRRPVVAVLLAAAVLVGGSVRLFAEDLDVPKLFDSAKASFGEKRYGKCWSDLALVVAEVGRMRMEALKTVLPAGPTGWTAGEAEGDNAAGWAFLVGGTHVRRRSTRGEDGSLDVDLWADAPAMLTGLTMFIQNPAFVPAGSKIVTIKGRRALLEYRKDDKSGKLMIVLGPPGSMLQVEARGVTNAELADTIPAAFDLDAIEKAISN